MDKEVGKEKPSLKDELMKKSLEELREELNRGFADDSMAYTQLGMLGVSPKHLKMYEESVEKIRALQHSNGQ